MALILTKAPVMGLNTRIVSILREYKTMPIRLLARLTDQLLVDIEEQLQRLQKAGLVKVDGDMVSLAAATSDTASSEEEWLARA